VHLLRARCSAGHNLPRPAVAILLHHLPEKIRSHRHAQIVEILFIPEAPGHPATFHVRGHDIESQFAEQRERGLLATNRLLLTVCMKK